MTSIPDRPLLRWLEECNPDRGLHFAESAGGWQRWSFADLAELTMRAAGALQEQAVRRGDVVALVQRSSPAFVASLFGAMAVGAVPCVIAPPFAFRRAEEYEAHVGHLLRTARPALVVADADGLEQVGRIAGSLGVGPAFTLDAIVDGATPLSAPMRPADHALLQFTSGSSGSARGVWVPQRALRANVTAIRRWIQWRPEDAAVSWLPVHHDMGLVGALIGCVVNGGDSWLFQPEDFIRSPLRYLECLSEQSAVFTVMPNFGLAYLLRRIRPAMLTQLRFDHLRTIVLGAERVDRRVLEDIEKLLGPFGLDRRVLQPAYGSAEATLAVTGLPSAGGWTTATETSSDPGRTPAEVVGCGLPLEGVNVSVVDDAGIPVSDGTVGEIVVSGTSVTDDYCGDAGTASGTELRDGRLRTGDAGFMRDGQLFVLGRLGDGLKVLGRMVFAESVEAELARRGVAAFRTVVLLGIHDGVATAAVVLEKPRDGAPERAAVVVREFVADARVLVLSVPPGGCAVTSSGKPRRRVMWRAFCAGSLCGELAEAAADGLVPAERDAVPDPVSANRLEERPRV